MELVEEHGRDARKLRIVQDHAGENAFGHDLDARLGGDFGLQPHAQPDGLADALAKRRGEAARGGARGETARLEQNELAVAAPGGVEQRERHARRLARAGRRDEHEIGGGDERGVEVGEDVVDRQAIGKGADQAGLQERDPLQMRDWRGRWQDGRKVDVSRGLNPMLGALCHVLSGAAAGVRSAPTASRGNCWNESAPPPIAAAARALWRFRFAPWH